MQLFWERKEVLPGGVRAGQLITAHLKDQAVVQQEARAVPVEPAVAANPPSPQVVSFEAPEDLPAGYQLEVEVDGRNMIATVPNGGARKGQMVTAPIHAPASAKSNDLPTGPLMPVPTGKWRNGFCDCCSQCSKALFWLSWCCSPVSLGQIMTRMGLNWLGESEEHVDHSAFYFLSIAWAIIYVYYIIFIGLAGGVAWAVFFCFWLYVLVMMIKTRMHIRKRYNIEGSAFGDCCASYWCGCCTLVQMATHTAAPRDLEAHQQCCTPTGLDDSVPPNQHLYAQPRNKAQWEEQQKKRKITWGILGGVMVVMLIVAAAVAA